MDNTISSNAKIQTPAADRQTSEPAAAHSSAPPSSAATTDTRDRPSAQAPISDNIQTIEAAQTALDRLKSLLAQQPSTALAAYNKITGQAADALLDSAVSAAS